MQLRIHICTFCNKSQTNATNITKNTDIQKLKFSKSDVDFQFYLIPCLQWTLVNRTASLYDFVFGKPVFPLFSYVAGIKQVS